ncbi:FUSC family protein [Streptomyces diastatochromogenes]|nr:FUSC family protein [Streptomyces diastatochromogenes]
MRGLWVCARGVGPPWESAAGAAVVAAATAVVAGVAKYVCDATRLGGLGAVLLLFSFAVAANASATWAEVLPTRRWRRPGRRSRGCWRSPAGSCIPSGRSAWRWPWPCVGSPRCWRRPRRGRTAADPARRHRRRPARVPVPRLSAAGSDSEQRARPRRGLPASDRPVLDPAGRLRAGAPGDPAATAVQLRRQAALLADRRRRTPAVLRELPFLPTASPLPQARDGGAGCAAGSAAARDDAAALRATELLVGRPGGPDHLAVLAVPALRMALGTGVAGGLAVLLHLEHGYWAAISAAAVLHSVNLRTTAQRAVQRTLGTLLGLLIALGVLAAHPEPMALALVIAALEFLLEFVVVRNYGLGVVFLTPMALLLSDLAAPAPTGELVLDRVVGSVVGIGTGLLCALLVVHDRAAVRVERALDACVAAADRAERSLGRAGEPPPSLVQVRLAVAVVELRDADDAAAGELWPAGIDPAELAAAEKRAYVLLDRLHHHR